MFKRSFIIIYVIPFQVHLYTINITKSLFVRAGVHHHGLKKLRLGLKHKKNV